MKKRMNFYRRFIGVMAVLFVAAACSDDDPAGGGKGPGDGDDVVTPTEGVLTEAFYKGDYFEAGSGNLWVNFVSEMEYDDFEEDYVGPGYVICLDFNTTLAGNPDFATLAEGTYTGDSSHDSHLPFTLNLADGDSFVSIYTQGGKTTSLVTGGSVAVTVKEGYYLLDAALELEDGTTYEYEFVGTLTFLNRSGEGCLSNLTEDVAIADLTQALVIYSGEVFTETSDLYNVIIAGADYDLDENFGQSPAVSLALNVTPGSSAGIPSGTYTVIDAETADDYDAFTALSGVYEPAYGGYFGTWYFSPQDRAEASLRGGEVTVTDHGSDRYTFDWRLTDGYGNAVTGSFSGVCRVENWS